MPYMGRAHTKMRLIEANNDDRSSMSGISFRSQSDVERDRYVRKRQRQVTFNKRVESNDGRGLRACLVTRAEQRLTAGVNNPADRKIGPVITSPGECTAPPPGVNYLQTPETQVTTSEIKMTTSMPTRRINKCGYFPQLVDTRTVKTVGTQTLYRESSAQTLPYLPEVDDRENAETLELFNLTTILPGDKPPGLYEVEILERSRKRWAFTTALKTNFKRQFREAREKIFKSKYRNVLEAFEWEKWIEREEYIQECQMMRLDIVVRMFDRREKQMHNASKTRIEVACEKIEERRQAALHKNEIQFQRAMRRLENKKRGLKSSRHHESIAYQLSSPCSEFYAPLMRHGVSPARRHFTGGRKAFDMRIDELEKRVNMKKLECPFSKLKKWAQPKTHVKEYEQNFCSDANLQKLYETLRSLRTQAVKRKIAPKCLVRRQQIETVQEETEKTRTELHKVESLEPSAVNFESKSDETETESVESKYPEDLSKQLLYERRKEELENMLYRYEGSTIGWIMQFLTEEMERLREQRKLHFFSILAQKERWRREAAEAGLRQKENDMRFIYEELFELTDVVNSDICKDYLDSVLTTDMAHDAEWTSAKSITNLAKLIDEDINRWLESLKLIQTPLTYEPLRYILRDYIFPDVNDLLQRNEKTLIAKYIIEDVLFPRIERELEPFDIISSITGEFLDRLIDDDLYYFSTDSESEHISSNPAEYEAEAILRKLLRYGTPGRRWRTETERNIDENVRDLLDDIFDTILANQNRESILTTMEPVEIHEALSKVRIDADSDLERRNRMSLPQGESELLRTATLSIFRKFKEDKISKPLVKEDIFEGDDGFKDTDPDSLVENVVYLTKEEIESIDNAMGPVLYRIPSTLDIGEVENFRKLINIVKLQKMLEIQKIDSSSLSDIGIKFEKKPKETDTETQTYTKDILMNVLKTIIPSDDEEKADMDTTSLSFVEAEVGYRSSSESVVELFTNQQDRRGSSTERSRVVSNIMMYQSDENLISNKPTKPHMNKSVSRIALQKSSHRHIKESKEPTKRSGYVAHASLFEKISSNIPLTDDEMKSLNKEEILRMEEIKKELSQLKQTTEGAEKAVDGVTEQLAEEILKEQAKEEITQVEKVSETQATQDAIEAETKAEVTAEINQTKPNEEIIDAPTIVEPEAIKAVENLIEIEATENITQGEAPVEVTEVVEEPTESQAKDQQAEFQTVEDANPEQVGEETFVSSLNEQEVLDTIVDENQETLAVTFNSEKEANDIITEQQNENVTVIEQQNNNAIITEQLEDTATVTEQHEENVAITELLEETVAITEQPKETVAVTEEHEETIAVTEQHEETIAVTEQHEKTIAVTEQREETAAITEQHEETVAVTEQHEETVIVTEQMEETVTDQQVDVLANDGHPEVEPQ